MKFSFLYVLILISVSSVCQNPYLNKTINVNGSEIGNNVIADDDGYVLGGTTAISGKSHNLITKLDLQGNVLWKHVNSVDSINTGGGRTGSLITFKTGYLMAGDLILNDTFQPYWMQFDSSGEVIESRILAHEFSYRAAFWSALQTKDGGFLTTGFAMNITDSTADLLVVKFDSNKAIEWSETYTYGSNLYEEGFNVVEANDGYVVGGAIGKNNSFDADTWVVKINKQGVKQWEKNLNLSEYTDGVASVVVSSTNEIYVSCRKAFNTATQPDRSLKVFKYFPNGTQQWEKEFGPTIGSDGYANIKELGNGNLVVISIGFFPAPGNPLIAQIGQAIFLNPEGDSLGTRYFYYNYTEDADRFYYPWDVEATPDGGFVIGGFVEGNGFPHDLWIMKFDSLGCFDPEFDCVLGSEESVAQQGELKLAPNPANSQLKVFFESAGSQAEHTISIYSVDGREVLNQALPESSNFFELDISMLPAGVYSCQLHSDGKLIASEKFIVVS